MTKRPTIALLFVAIAVAFSVAPASATVYRVVGHGTIPTSFPTPAGVAGEEITVKVDLDTADWTYLPVTNTDFHYFIPLVTVPVNVTGSITGVFPNIDPVDRLVAFEGTGGSPDDDFISLDNGAGGGVTTVMSFSSVGSSGFDGDLGPFTPEEVFLLLKSAIESPADWNTYPAINIFMGGADEILYAEDATWSMTVVPEPATNVLLLFGTAMLLAMGRRSRRPFRRG